MDYSACLECGSTSLVQTTSDVVCASCGLVQAGSMAVSEEMDPHRLHVSGDLLNEPSRYPSLFTVCHPDGGQRASDAERPPDARKKMRIFGGRSTPVKTKKRRQVEAHAKEIIDGLRIPDGIATAALDMLRDMPKITGRRMDKCVAVAMACIYITCHRAGVTRSFRELSKASGISSRVIVREHKAICNVGIDEGASRSAVVVIEDRLANDIMARAIEGIPPLDMDQRRKLAATARKLLSDNASVHTQGKRPMTVAAAFAWKAVVEEGLDEQLSLTLGQVANACNVHVSSVRDLMKKL